MKKTFTNINLLYRYSYYNIDLVDNPNLYKYKTKPDYSNSELLAAYEYQRKNRDKVCIKLKDINGEYLYFLRSKDENREETATFVPIDAFSRKFKIYIFCHTLI